MDPKIAAEIAQSSQTYVGDSYRDVVLGLRSIIENAPKDVVLAARLYGTREDGRHFVTAYFVPAPPQPEWHSMSPTGLRRRVLEKLEGQLPLFSIAEAC